MCPPQKAPAPTATTTGGSPNWAPAGSVQPEPDHSNNPLIVAINDMKAKKAAVQDQAPEWAKDAPAAAAGGSAIEDPAGNARHARKGRL